MRFSIKQKVKTTSVTDRNFGNAPALKGDVVGIYCLNNDVNQETFYSVKDNNGRQYNYPESALSEIKSQTLYAYKDATDEVHWSTRKYDSKERTNFGFVEAFEFNKTIDLE